MRNKILNLIYFFGTLTFFGLFYPEYVFLPDTCVYVSQDGEEKKALYEEGGFGWQEMSGEVVVESRVFNFFMNVFGTEGTDICQQNKNCQDKQNIIPKQKQQLECLIREWED